MIKKVISQFRVVGLFIPFLLIQCVGADNKAIEIVEKSIEYHGGWATWNDLESVRFTKNSILYTDDGSVESEIAEKFTITLQPGFQVTIVNQNSVGLHFDGENYRKTKAEVEMPVTSADTSAIQASFFVMSQPFSLIDENVTLTLEGKDSILGREVMAVSARYGEAKKENHPWIYYLDTLDYRLLASRVHHPPTYALIVNENTVEYKGIVWNTQRTTYRVDSMNNILFVRAKYVYDFE